MKKIPLTKDKYTLVDDEDYKYLSLKKWCCSTGGYAVRSLPRIKGQKRQTEWMHRLIMKAPRGMEVDHINHDTLDNRKINLRVCTKNENQHNRIKNKKTFSNYKGVHWHKKTKKWQAQININQKMVHLGYFYLQKDAAFAYNQAALKNFGIFACINIVKKVSVND